MSERTRRASVSFSDKEGRETFKKREVEKEKDQQKKTEKKRLIAMRKAIGRELLLIIKYHN